MANKSKKKTVLSKIYNLVSMNLGAVKGGWKGGNGQACTLVLLSLSEPEHWASWTTGLTKQNISYVLMMMPRTGQNLKIFQHGMTYCTDMLRPFFKNVLRDQHIPSQHKVHFCSSNAKGKKGLLSPTLAVCDVFHKCTLTHSWASLLMCSAFEGYNSGCRMGIIIHVFLLQDTVKCARIIREIKTDHSFPLFGLHILDLIITKEEF